MNGLPHTPACPRPAAKPGLNSWRGDAAPQALPASGPPRPARCACVGPGSTTAHAHSPTTREPAARVRPPAVPLLSQTRARARAAYVQAALAGAARTDACRETRGARARGRPRPGGWRGSAGQLGALPGETASRRGCECVSGGSRHAPVCCGAGEEGEWVLDPATASPWARRYGSGPGPALVFQL